VTTNLGASVHARLANQAKAKGRPFQELLQHYGLERLLYRLASSSHQSRFLLKGALLLQAWGAPASRPTRDIVRISPTVNTQIGRWDHPRAGSHHGDVSAELSPRADRVKAANPKGFGEAEP
jgi:hypothetical protein